MHLTLFFRRFILAGMCAVGAVALGIPGDVRAETPLDGATAFIQDIGDKTVAALADDGAGDAERRNRLAGVLQDGLDIRSIGRFVLGRHWRAASDEQRKSYDRLFERYLVTTYVERLNRYTDASFAVVDAQPVGNNADAMVVTAIQPPEGETITASWRVRGANDKFKILDLLVEGVSMAVTQRADFNALIKKGGFDGLLSRLQEMVNLLDSGAPELAQKPE